MGSANENVVPHWLSPYSGSSPGNNALRRIRILLESVPYVVNDLLLSFTDLPYEEYDDLFNHTRNMHIFCGIYSIQNPIQYQ